MDFLPNIIPYSGEVTATEVKIMSTMIGVSNYAAPPETRDA